MTIQHTLLLPDGSIIQIRNYASITAGKNPVVGKWRVKHFNSVPY